MLPRQPFVVLLLLLFLAGCGGPAEEATPVTDAGPTAVVVVPATEAAAPTETAAPTASPAPTETALPTASPVPTEPPATETPEGPVADSCVSCHSNQQLLISTAAPVEEKESSESSGVG